MADSNLGCGPLTIKYLVFVFNLLFFLSGLMLIIVGGIAQVFFHKNIQFFDGNYETPGIGLIILGSVILVIAFFGCCGAKKENVFMLRIFAFLMIIVLLLEFAAAIAIAVLRPKIADMLEKNMEKTMNEYGAPGDVATKTWDDLQNNHHCCGTGNYTDWFDTPFYVNTTKLPESCSCHGDDKDCIPFKGQLVHEEGCYQKLVDAARHNLGAIIGGIIGLTVLQMIGVWMSCCLIKAVKERYEIL